MKNVQLTRLAPFNFGVVLYSPLRVQQWLPDSRTTLCTVCWRQSVLVHTAPSENRGSIWDYQSLRIGGPFIIHGDGTGTNHGRKVEEEGTRYINYTFFMYNKNFTFNQRITLNSHICKKFTYVVKGTIKVGWGAFSKYIGWMKLESLEKKKAFFQRQLHSCP